MDIHKLIAGISPETYCRPESAKQVRRLLRKKDTVSPPEAVLQAARFAEPKPANLLPLERLEEMDLFECPGLKSPRAQFTYARDAMAESIEAFYFSILNHLEELEEWQVFKLVDEFQASLLASPFADATKQQSLIQRQVFEGLEAIHALTRDILNAVKQLEEEQANTGQGSDASADEPVSGASSDLEIRRAQLRSQLALLKLRAGAIRPWLQRGEITAPLRGRFSSLVNAFNTAVFQVVLLAVGPDVLPEAIENGALPQWIARKVRRKYRPVLVLELSFRARPQRRRSHGYAYRGSTELVLTSYGLHDDELSVLRQAVEQSAVQEAFQLEAGETAEGLNDLVHRIEQLVDPKKYRQVNKLSQDVNPFKVLLVLLIGSLRWLLGRRDSGDGHGLQADTALDSVVRSLAILQAGQPVKSILDAVKAARS